MRPKTFNPDEAILHAMQSFWRRGFESTSMPDLLEAMGLGRASFYNAFGSKRDVFLRCLDLYFAVLDRHLSEVCDQAPNREKAVENLADAILRVARQDDGYKGCLIGNTALELAAQDAEIRAQTTQGIRVLKKIFAKALAKQPAHNAPHVRHSERDALQLVAGIQGLLVLAKAGVPESEILGLRNALVKSIN
jgi:TetR/AcrR family transcriptional regulator, transcriptional repressor for nem operon